MMKKLCLGDVKYPKKLSKIPKPPINLYIEGEEKLFDSIGIAVVGTRHPSSYGERMCTQFTQELVKYGVTIIAV